MSGTPLLFLPEVSRLKARYQRRRDCPRSGSWLLAKGGVGPVLERWNDAETGGRRVESPTMGVLGIEKLGVDLLRRTEEP